MNTATAAHRREQFVVVICVFVFGASSVWRCACEAGPRVRRRSAAGAMHVSGRVIEPGEEVSWRRCARRRWVSSGSTFLPSMGRIDRAEVLAFWQGVMPRAEAKKKLFVDDTVLCELFERLADATEPASSTPLRARADPDAKAACSCTRNTRVRARAGICGTCA